MTTVVGMRVVRGPDWEGVDKDGEKTPVGTVMEVLEEYTVRVLWDTGVESTCRAGRDGKLDLRIFDTAPVGVRHLGETCAVCGEKDVCGMLWRCGDCDDCCLCTQCYCEDKHDVDHEFLRVDTPGISGTVVNSRKSSLKVQAVGIFPGAKVRKVKRHNNEEVYGSKGEVEGYETGVPHKCRSMLRVRWSDDTVETCCLGEIICFEKATGTNYYRDHLPLLDVRMSLLLESHPELCKSEMFSEDDCTQEAANSHNAPSTRPAMVPSSPHDETGVKVDGSSDLLSADRDAEQNLLLEKGSLLHFKHSKDNNDGELSLESSMWLDKTYDTSDYNLTRNCDTEVIDDDVVTSRETNIQQSVEDKGKFAEGLFDREATGLDCDTTSQESEQPINLSFDLTKDRGKNEIMELSSDEEEKETDDKERELQVDVGDSVAIKVGERRLEELQKAHGGCTKEMKQAFGMTGRVVMKPTAGSVQVEFKSLGQYLFSPEALIKVSQVKQGDIVRIRSEKDQVIILNHRVGWKDEMTLTLGKVGRVAKVDSDGDALVIFGRSAFLYSPSCCIPEPGAQTDSLVVSKNILHRTSPSASEVKDSAIQEQNKALFLKMREMVLGQSSMSHIDHDDQVHRLFDAIYVGDGETVARLCRKNKSLLASRRQRFTPIMLASTRHSLEVVELLLDLGADINMSIPPNKTALGAAIEAKREEIACLLIYRGADLSYVDNNKMSYVHLAAYHDMATVVGLLVAEGADINAKDKDMDTPLLMAVQRGSHRAMEALLSMSGIDVRTKNHKGFSALQLACQEGYASAVEKMLVIDKSGVDDFYHGVSTSLHLAAMSDQAECVRLLVINGGASVNSHGSGMMFNCPLHIACHMARLQSVEALLELGADVNAQDSSGDTPLHLTIGGRTNKDDESECQLRVAIGCMLISKGAYVDARNRKGRHPFSYGSAQIREGIGRFIRQNKALVKSRYKNG